MSGMGGKMGFILQFHLQILQQWLFASVLLCCQVSQKNLGQVYISAWLLLVTQATPSNCGKLLSSHQYRSGVERSAQQHRGETHGYGKNLMIKDYPQPSPNDDASAHLRMQFRDLMSVGQRRLNTQTNTCFMSWHKVKSVPLETGSARGFKRGRYSMWEESLLGVMPMA